MTICRLVSRPFGKFLCAVLAASMVIGPIQQTAAQAPVAGRPVEQRPRKLTGGDKTLVAEPEAETLDLKYVTPQSVALVVLRPHQILTSPNTALLPIEVVTAAGLQHLGIDPIDVTEVTIFVEPPSIMGLQYGAVVKFERPFDLLQLREQFRSHIQVAEIGGKEYFQSGHPQMPSFYMPDDRTLLVMPDVTLRKTLAPADANATSPLLQRVGNVPGGDDLYVTIDVASLRPLIVPWMNVAVAQQRDQFPEQFKPFLEVPNLVSSADLKVNISNTGVSRLELHANDALSADKLESLYSLAEEIQRKAALENAARFQQSNDPIQQAFGKYLERMSHTKVDQFKYQRRGDDLVLFEMSAADGSPQSQLVLVAVTGMLVALILPAVQAAREAARRNQSLSQLKQVMLAMHVYADSKRVLPAHAIYSQDGKPLLSWRVTILPYIEQQELYNRFKLDEPWDSPHNKALIPLMPEVYANPAIVDPSHGMTNILAFVGPDCVMDGTSKGLGFAQIPDGTSKTMAVVEANPANVVPWTKPADIEFDPKNPKAGFGALRPGGCNAAFWDGHARFISNSVDPATIKALITRDGREPVDLE
jgi:prepilin-type processing-associated H-X9-DG protein